MSYSEDLKKIQSDRDHYFKNAERSALEWLKVLSPEQLEETMSKRFS
jgi:hypothetical protein